MKLTKKQKAAICLKFHTKFFTAKQLAKSYKMSTVTIKAIVRGQVDENGNYIQRPVETIQNKNRWIGKERWKRMNVRSRFKFMISDYGRIKSFALDKKQGRILNLKINAGYLAFDYTDILTGERKSILVHVLVAQHFLRFPYSFKESNSVCVIHKDFNRANNKAANLEYMDRRDAMSRNKTSPFFKRNVKKFASMPENRRKGMKNIKMTATKVLAMKKELHQKKLSTFEASVKYGISEMQVARIHRGENWPNVAPQYSRKICRKAFNHHQPENYYRKG